MPSNASPWWLKLLAGVGAYALTTEVLKQFASFSLRIDDPRATDLPPPGSQAFLQSLSASLNTSVYRGGEATLINNGDAFFDELFDAIEEAEQSVHCMSYIWKPGTVMDRMFDLLVRKAEAGVEVRLMLDGIGALAAPNEHIERLRAAGGQVTFFNPLLSSQIIRVFHRNHRRSFVIDGAVGFTGGMAIADRWLGDGDQADHWRDTMVRVTGPMVHTVQGFFVHLWTNVTGEQLVGDAYFPRFEDPDELEDDPDERAEGKPMSIGVVHAPHGQIQPLFLFYWLTFAAARERIWMSTGYFNPNKHFRALFMEQARAGVDVRLLVPSRHTDNPLVRWAGQHFYDEFLEAGVRIYEFTPAMLHAKHMLVDDGWCAIGSANLDVRSIKLNFEVVLGIADQAFGSQLEETFEDDFARAHEITREEWRGRGWHETLVERAALLLRGQY